MSENIGKNPFLIQIILSKRLNQIKQELSKIEQRDLELRKKIENIIDLTSEKEILEEVLKENEKQVLALLLSLGQLSQKK